MATATRHRIPLVVIVCTDDAFGNARRIRQDVFDNRVIASDLEVPVGPLSSPWEFIQCQSPGLIIVALSVGSAL